MSELDDFREQVGAWLDENAPASLIGVDPGLLSDTAVWGGQKAVYENPDAKRWLEVCAAKGYTAPTWPKEYGGGGMSRAEEKVFERERAKRKIMPPLIGFGLSMIGPTLLRYGTDAQKAQHLPRITAGEIRWCQGYSEPGAGSDLAAVQTRAVRDGDDYIINGQKVWTSYGDRSDWIFALVRTDPNAAKHNGITFLLIDMTSPGVSVKPIKLISGSSPFCETYFDDVRVPVANVIHEENDGWTVAKALLGHERGMIADTFGGTKKRRKYSTQVELAFEHLGERDGQVADARLRDELVQTEMDARALALTVQRTADAAKAGQQPGAETSMFKLYGTEINQRRDDLKMRILGPQGLGWEGAGFAEDELAITRDWLRSRGNTIEGGTSEIQLNIIAKRVLGLPD